MVELFLPELFRRWQAHSTNHAVSLILFSRVLYDDHEVPLLTHGSALSTDPLGRKCLDVYKALLNLEVGISWAKVVETLRVELDRFQKSLLLEYSPRVDGALAGRISAAHEGNVLEALNLASKQFEKRYMVRILSGGGPFLMRYAGKRLAENWHDNHSHHCRYWSLSRRQEPASSDKRTLCRSRLNGGLRQLCQMPAT